MRKAGKDGMEREKTGKPLIFKGYKASEVG